MSALRTLKLLSWKYYRYRQFYWIWTIGEFLLPILVVFATVTIADKIIGRTSLGQPPYKPVPASEKELVQRFKYERLYYTPSDSSVNELLFRAREIYGTITQTPWEFPVLEAMPDEEHLVMEISKAVDRKSIGVVFLTYQLNKQFVYKIRDRETWNTTTLFVSTETVHNGPFYPDPYFDSGFAGLQYIIDRAIIRSISPLGGLIKVQETTFESFPYPQYISTDKLRFLTPIIIAVAVVVSSLIILGPLSLTIIHERSSGLIEMMKLAGLHEGLNWLSWFMHTFLFGLVVYTIIVFILSYDKNGPQYSSIRVVELSLLWTIVILYFFAQIAFCFVFCVLFNSALVGVSSFFVITLSMGYGAIKVHDYRNFVLVHLSCLCPAGAFVQAFQRITYYEILEVPVTWEYVFTKELTATEASLGFVLMMLLVDAAIYLTLTWYIDAVYPGKFGYKKSPLFFIWPEKSTIIENVKKTADAEIEEDNPFVEKTSDTNTHVGITLKNLKKSFGPVEAVKGVNMAMYKDEIYVILGYEKSGKTTTLSMITGLTEPTEGQVLYKDTVDLLRSFKEYKGILGFCPQENRLFPYFSIIDHMLFYGGLKGGEQNHIEEQATQYLEWMGIYENADDLASVVSAEMKRKLSISIGLMGNSEILVIDEPTTGLEPISKRRIWSLLMELKYDRTIIMTSSNVQEASVLGDRIAMMNSGLVVCAGSLKFLNDTFATGYEIKIKKKPETMIPTTKEKDQIFQLVNLVEKSVPGSKTILKTTSELVFTLPADTPRFPDLFKNLESKKGPFKIDRIEVSCSTLEKVFLKIGGESIYDPEGKPLKLNAIVEEALQTNVRSTEKLGGIPLLLEQHKALFLKKNTFTYRTWYIFFYRAFIPTVLMTILLWGTVKFDIVDPPVLFSVDTYNLKVIVLENSTFTNNDYQNVFYSFLSSQEIEYEKIEERPTLQQILLEKADDNIASYRRETLIAVTFLRGSPNMKNPDSYLKQSVAYNKFARHSLPIAINLLTNTLLRFRHGIQAPLIMTYNHPIKKVNVTREQDKFNTDISETSPVITVWYLVIAFFTIDLLDFVSAPVLAERIDGFKHVQFLSSVSPLTYWINTFLFDFLFFCIIVAVRLLVFQLLDVYGFFAIQVDFIIVVLLLVLFMASGLLFMYLWSFVLKTRYGAYAFFTTFNIICTIVTLSFYKFQEGFWRETSFHETVILYIARLIIWLIPPLNFNLAFEKYLTAWRVNHIIEAYARYGISKIGASDSPSDPENLPKYTPYLEFAGSDNPNGILGEIIFLIIDIFLYAFIIYNIEFGYIYRLLNQKLSTSNIGSKQKKREGEVSADVLEEQIRVRDAVKSKKTDTTIYLIAQQLRKVYQPVFAIFSKQKVVVQDVSFLVHSGECFGIVGPRNSGKTTIFKMLAGEVTPTLGDSWILNTKLAADKTEYYAKAGYCAQSDSFLEELTGSEILSLVAALRGIMPKQRQDIIERWVTILGLGSVISRKCSSYDEGNRRKICAALALIGDPEVVLLDEPTTRIDPLSRRSLYTAFSQIKSEGRAIVLSFHSMQECGNLCDRFTIMIEGQMKFIGTSDEMMNKFGVGFTMLVIVKEPHESDTDDSRVDDILQLKYAIQAKFKTKKLVLLTESKGSVMYDFRDTIGWADAFKRMEELKNNLKFIETYQISDKSLEEVFLSIVKGKLKST